MIVRGTNERPRIFVFRSNKYMYAQVIDDEKRKTLFSISDFKIKSGNKTEKALKIGESLADQMKEKKMFEAVFDRGGFKFHGRVSAVAKGLRSGGIKF